MPDLREESPSKIAAGFGGTLSLVISAMYIILIVMLTALPTHFYLSALQNEMDLHTVQLWLLAGTAAACGVGLIATLVPMAIGLRAFRASNSRLKSSNRLTRPNDCKADSDRD